MTFKLAIFIQFRNLPYYLRATYKLARRRNAITGRIDDGQRRQQEVRPEMGTEESARPGTYKWRYSHSRREVAK